MRRSGFVPRSDFQVEIAHKKKRAPVSAWRFQAGSDQADYVMLRSPDEKGEMVNTNRFKAPADHHKAPAQPPEDRKISAATPASVVAAA